MHIAQHMLFFCGLRHSPLQLRHMADSAGLWLNRPKQNLKSATVRQSLPYNMVKFSGPKFKISVIKMYWFSDL